MPTGKKATPAAARNVGPPMSKKQIALAALQDRREHRPKQIDNSSLYAGSLMYFYCVSCGHESDCLPESYVTRPKTLCGPCQELKDLGWLE